MFRLCLPLLSLLIVQSLSAQPPGADSLRQSSRSPQLADTNQVRQLHAQAQKLVATNLPQALALEQQALALAQHLHDTPGQAAAYLELSLLYRRQAQYEPARRAVQQARQLYARLGNSRRQANCYLGLSIIEMAQGNHVSALTAGLQGLPLAEQAGDRKTYRRLQATLGTLYVKLEDYPTAIPILQAALQGGRQDGDLPMVGAVLNDLGSVYTAQKDWSQALRYYQQALMVMRQQHDAVGEAVDEMNIADVYRQQGRYALARSYGRRAYARAVAGHDTYSLPYAQLILAQVYDKLGQPDSAFALARPSFQQGQQARIKDVLRDVSDVLAKLYAQRGDFAAAYRYQGLAVAYKDTLAGEATLRKTAALRYGYALDKKQSQIALLTKSRELQRQQSARQRQQLYLLLAGLAGVAVAAGLLWRTARLKQRANRRLGEKNQEIAHQRDALDHAFLTLQATQSQLIQKEKMASLGELTAGIAHEIQNPLNFVNNFSEVSTELVEELQEALAASDTAEASALAGDVAQNLSRITEHGKRAAGIVRGMLEHSRVSTGERQRTDVNALADEYWRLAYHGLRTKDQAFQVALQTDLAPDLPPVEAVPGDLGRVLLNLFTNAFYAVQQRAGETGYVPTVRVQTRGLGSQIQIQVQDNGMGMSPETQAKIFQPFFTTKPTGEGTGLGLSLSYDLITKGHGGTITVESQLGQGATFTITLPVG